MARTQKLSRMASFLQSIYESFDLLGQKDYSKEDLDQLFFYDYQGETPQELHALLKEKSAVLCVDFSCLNEKEKLHLRDFSFMSQDLLLTICDLATEVTFSMLQVKNLIDLKNYKGEFKCLSDDLSKLLFSEIPDLERIKQIHSALVSLRQETFDHIGVISKYRPGKNNGGDYFQTFKKGKELLFFLSTSQSYLTSMTTLKLLDDLHKADSFSKENLASFMKTLCQNLEEQARPKLLLLTIDLTTLLACGFIFGDHQMISDGKLYHTGQTQSLNEAFFDKNYFEFSLNDGDKFLILSHGLSRNLQGFVGEKTLAAYVKERIRLTSKDFLNEFFFYLKKNEDQKFLDNDAYAVLIEVGHT